MTGLRTEFKIDAVFDVLRLAGFFVQRQSAVGFAVDNFKVTFFGGDVRSEPEKLVVNSFPAFGFSVRTSLGKTVYADSSFQNTLHLLRLFGNISAYDNEVVFLVFDVIDVIQDRGCKGG